MNGIYNFDGYRTPYLDMEMLMERKEAKRKRKLLFLSIIAMILMSIIAVSMLYLLSLENKMACMIMSICLCTYVVIGVLIVGKCVKKGEYLWQ